MNSEKSGCDCLAKYNKWKLVLSLYRSNSILTPKHAYKKLLVTLVDHKQFNIQRKNSLVI